MSKGIFFQETSDAAAEFLHELNDPDLVRAQAIPRDVTLQLRREQIRKLEGNIETLREKQSQFNCKMEEYVTNLRRLIDGLHSSPDSQEETAGSPAESGGAAVAEPEGPKSEELMGVRVRCQQCEEERTFEHLQILFARESQDSIHQPTECYVTDAGTFKKGVFFCGNCGGEMLTIQARP